MAKTPTQTPETVPAALISRSLWLLGIGLLLGVLLSSQGLGRLRPDWHAALWQGAAATPLAQAQARENAATQSLSTALTALENATEAPSQQLHAANILTAQRDAQYAHAAILRRHVALIGLLVFATCLCAGALALFQNTCHAPAWHLGLHGLIAALMVCTLNSPIGTLTSLSPVATLVMLALAICLVALGFMLSPPPSPPQPPSNA